MSLGTALEAMLASDAAEDLAELIGDRMYGGDAEQGTAMPYVCWKKIGADPIQTHNEKVTEETCIQHVQFTVFAATYASLEAVSNALKAAIDHEVIMASRLASFDDETDIESAVPSTYARACDFVI